MSLVTTSALEPKRLKWTARQVAAFWDYCSTRPSAEREYFSNQFGQAVVSLARWVQPLKGKTVLDYGCGPGHLVPWLISAGAYVKGVDQSPRSVEAANRRFTGQAGWLGAELCGPMSPDVKADQFDAVFCLETIEHLDDDALTSVLADLRQRLSAVGFAFITTPYDEDLDKEMSMCPDCGAEFHRWQHVRKWTPETLRSRLVAAGFDVIFCEGLNLAMFQNQRPVRLIDQSIRSIGNAIRMQWAKLSDSIAPRPFPDSREFRRFTAGHARRNLVSIVRLPSR